MLNSIKKYLSSLKIEMIDYKNEKNINYIGLAYFIIAVCYVVLVINKPITLIFTIISLLCGVIGLLIGMLFSNCILKLDDDKHGKLIEFIMTFFALSFFILGILLVFNYLI